MHFKAISIPIQWKLLLSLPLAVIFGCTEESGYTDPEGPIEDQIEMSGLLETASVEAEPTYTPQDTIELEPINISGGELRCNETAFTAEQVRSLANMVASDGMAGIIYPGALIQGGKFQEGDFTPITIPRAGGEITLTGLSGGSDRSIDISEFSASEVEEKTAELLQGLSGEVQGTVANFGFFVEETNSREEFRFHMGLDGRYRNVSVESQLEIEKERTGSLVTMQFTQVFYSIFIDDPETMYSLFRDGVNATDPENQIGGGNPPLYVKRVDYGRQIFFRAETTSNTEDVKAILRAAVESRPIGEIRLESGLEVSKVLSQTSISYVVRGGSAAIALQAAPSYENVVQVIRQGAEWDLTNPAAPIAYELRYLVNKEPARMAFAADFVRKSCDLDLPNVTRYRIKLDRIQCYDCEPFGEVEGGKAEFYGEAYIKTSQQANEVKYNLGITDVNLEGTKAYPNRAATFDFTEVSGSDKIFVRGYLTENDPTNDDNFGEKRREIGITVFGDSGEFSLDFTRGSGLSYQRARVWFVVTKL
jgi:hypothetical protein